MADKSRLYSLISSVASEDPRLNYDRVIVDMNREENTRRSTQKKIENLLESSYDRIVVPENVENQVRGMLTDITDGRFKAYLNRNPVELKGSVNCNSSSDRVNHLKFLTGQIEQLKATANELYVLNAEEKHQSDESIQKQLQDVDTAQKRLDTLSASLDKLKSMLNEIINPKLTDEVRRDLIFESNVKEVCETINNFNKFVETKKNLERLCRTENRQDTPQADEIPAVISSLLRSVEEAVLQDNF